jgi:DNA-binding transcriptional LysR family regulator
VLSAANTEAVITQVGEGSADLGFTEGPQRPPGLASRVIGHDRLVVVVAPGHPWVRRRRGISPQELAAAPLASREGGSGTRDTLAAALATALGPAVAQAPAALSLSTTAAVRAAALAGAAPAVISDLAVSDDLAAGRLIRVETHGLDLRRALRAVWNGPSSPPAGPARDLIAHILARQHHRRNTGEAGGLVQPSRLANRGR